MSPLQTGHQVQLLQGAAELFPALIRAMDAAQQEVVLETYIFDFTATGADIGHALVRAAERGVRVCLMVDGVGTGQMPDDWQARLLAAGVRWQVFNAVGRLGLLQPSRWRRLHRKLCAVDAGGLQAVAFCGGINVLDDFYDPNHGQLSAPRFDFCVQITGPLVNEVSDACGRLWQRGSIVQQLRAREFYAALQGVQGVLKESKAALFNHSTRASSKVLTQAQIAHSAVNADNADHTHNTTESRNSVKAALLLRDNIKNRKLIERAYLKAIGSAHQEVLIANAYFLPGQRLRRALIAASHRGVKVQLLLQGKYEYFMQYHAARPIYSQLLAAGVEIYEYAPSFLHAKVAVVDAETNKPWATVGSSNLDPLSLLLAREANVVVQDSGFAQDLKARLVHAMALEGKRIDPALYAQRPLGQRILDHIALGLMRTALWVTGKRY